MVPEPVAADEADWLTVDVCVIDAAGERLVLARALGVFDCAGDRDGDGEPLALGVAEVDGVVVRAERGDRRGGG